MPNVTIKQRFVDKVVTEWVAGGGQGSPHSLYSAGVCEVCKSPLIHTTVSDIVYDSTGKDIYLRRYFCEENGHLHTAGSLSYVGDGIVRYPPRSIKEKPQRLCQCGAWSVGAPDYSAAHTNSRTFTCPAFQMYK